MTNPRSISQSVSGGEFLSSVARDVVRLAAGSEGLERWLENHTGSLGIPGKATRTYAHTLFGDTDDAVLFNAFLVLQVERCRRESAAAAAYSAASR